jgi:hypothetical protein
MNKGLEYDGKSLYEKSKENHTIYDPSSFKLKDLEKIVADLFSQPSEPRKTLIPGQYLLWIDDKEFIDLHKDATEFNKLYKLMPVGSESMKKINERKKLLLND